MSTPKKLTSYPSYWDELASRLGENAKAVVEITVPHKRDALTFRLTFYGYRNALRKHGGPDAPGLHACEETKVTITENPQTAEWDLKFERLPDTVSSLALKAKLRVMRSVGLEPTEKTETKTVRSQDEIFASLGYGSTKKFCPKCKNLVEKTDECIDKACPLKPQGEPNV